MGPDPNPATPGWIVSINSFQMSFFDDTKSDETNFGSLPQTVDVAIFEVTGAGWTSLWSTTQVLDSATSTATDPFTFSPTNASSSSQLRLQWALNGDWAGDQNAFIDAVAIDNITFSVAPIPLPGALPLLLGGIGLLGAVGAARRRRAA